MLKVSIEIFLAGFFAGIIAVVGGLTYLLAKIEPKEVNDSKDKSKPITSGKNFVLGTQPPTEKQLELIENVVTFVNSLKDNLGITEQDLGVKGRMLDDSEGVDTGHIANDNLSPENMEKDFAYSMKDLKERTKNLKLFYQNINDLAKSLSAFSKEVSKFSSSASVISAKLPNNQQQQLNHDPLVGHWWTLYSEFLDNLSREFEILGNLCQVQVAQRFHDMHEEIVSYEKKCTSDGSKHLALYKENLALTEMRRKKQEECKNKLTRVSDGSSGNASDISNRVKKLNDADWSLAEASDKLKTVEQECVDYLGSTLSKSQITSAKMVYDTKASLVQLASKMIVCFSRSISGTKDFILRIQNSSHIDEMLRQSSLDDKDDALTPSSSGSVAGSVPISSRERLYNENILKLSRSLEMEKPIKDSSVPHLNVTKQKESINKAADNTSDISNNANPNFKTNHPTNQLDMRSISTGCLASSAPSLIISKLPPQFADSIASESCIWFNAFCGRIYRDIANSEYFHNWMTEKLSILMNKGKKPDYIDSFKIDQVIFGNSPPILSNVKWIPHLPNPDFTQFSERFTMNGEKASSGTLKYEQDIKNFWANKNIDFDVSGSGHVTFTSGIQFMITTKIWVNFPVMHYSSIPIKLTLNVKDVSGDVYFGVRKSSTFMSFMEAPYMNFKAEVEFGDQFKFNNIPQVSEYLVAKMKSIIVNRYVYPGCHRMRLIWPKNWWPAGTENDWLPSAPNPASVDETGNIATQNGSLAAQVEMVSTASAASVSPNSNTSQVSSSVHSNSSSNNNSSYNNDIIHNTSSMPSFRDRDSSSSSAASLAKSHISDGYNAAEVAHETSPTITNVSNTSTSTSSSVKSTLMKFYSDIKTKATTKHSPNISVTTTSTTPAVNPVISSNNTVISNDNHINSTSITTDNLIDKSIDDNSPKGSDKDIKNNERRRSFGDSTDANGFLPYEEDENTPSVSIPSPSSAVDGSFTSITDEVIKLQNDTQRSHTASFDSTESTDISIQSTSPPASSSILSSSPSSHPISSLSSDPSITPSTEQKTDSDRNKLSMFKSLTSSVVRRASTSLSEASSKLSGIYHHTSSNNSSNNNNNSNNISNSSNIQSNIIQDKPSDAIDSGTVSRPSSSGSYLSMLKGVIGKSDRNDKPQVSSAEFSIEQLQTTRFRFKVNVVKGKYGLGLDLKQGSDGGMYIQTIKTLQDDSPHPCLVCDPALQAGDLIAGVNGFSLTGIPFEQSIQRIKESGQNVELLMERSSSQSDSISIENNNNLNDSNTTSITDHSNITTGNNNSVNNINTNNSNSDLSRNSSNRESDEACSFAIGDNEAVKSTSNNLEMPAVCSSSLSNLLLTEENSEIQSSPARKSLATNHFPKGSPIVSSYFSAERPPDSDDEM